MGQIMNYQLGNIPVYKYLVAAAIIFFSTMLKIIFDRIISRRLRKWAKKTSFEYDDILIRALVPPLKWAILVAGLYFGLRILLVERSGTMPNWLGKGIFIVVLSIVLWLAYRLADVITEIIHTVLSKSDANLSKQFTPMIRTSLRVIVLLIGGIMIVQNLGVNVSSLIAGLGIGGIAIALAAQDTLANIFGTFVMFSDRPFQVGDFVEFKGTTGTVEYIGFRSTKIRTPDKSLVSIPNKLFTSDMIQNWSERPVRRIKCNIELTYDAETKVVKKLMEMIREYIRNNEDFDKETIIVNFEKFEASALSVLVVCYAATTDYDTYLRILEDLNFVVKQMVDELDLIFAYPSQSIYIEKNPQ